APGVRRSTAEARRLVLAARHVYVAGDESSSYAEGADGLHHQHREVAAAAAAAVERHSRRLHARFLAPLVRKTLLDRIGQRHQEMARLRRSAGSRELMRPAVEVAFRIVVQTLDRAGDVRKLFGKIGKRIEARARIDL